MQQIKHLPTYRHDGQLGWFHTVPFTRPMPVRQATENAHFDVLIVGAGFTGLATAGRLAELRPEARIAVVDALEVGQGSSGRNAGFIIDVPHTLDPAKPDAVLNGMFRDLNNMAIARLKAIQTQQGLDVCWHEAGKYLAAHEDKHVANLTAFTTMLESIGERYDTLTGSTLAKRLGTDYYKSAIYTAGNVLVNPAALALSVASALPSNVTLLENSPILQVDCARKTVQTANAQLSAKTLVLATNAFSEQFGIGRRAITPVFTYASMTRPLRDAELTQFDSVQPWGLTSAHPAGTTVRLTSDRRLFIRNVLNYQPHLTSNQALLAAAKAQHRQSYAARFPALQRVPFEHTWGGLICVTTNHEPVFTQHAQGVYAAAAMNGVGVAKGTYLGYYMAEWICGKPSVELDFILQHAAPSWVPPDPIRSLGAKLRLHHEARAAQGEI